MPRGAVYFWASFNVERVVESFLTEIAFFVGNPIIEPAMRLNNEFRHIALPLQIILFECYAGTARICKCVRGHARVKLSAKVDVTVDQQR